MTNFDKRKKACKLKPESELESKPQTSTIVWHKFPEEKPKKPELYSVIAPFNNDDGTITYELTIYEWIGSVNDWDGVTHWAELPEPPKEMGQC